MYVNFTVADKSNQIKSIVFLDSNENKMRRTNYTHTKQTHTNTHSIWVVGVIISTSYASREAYVVRECN